MTAKILPDEITPINSAELMETFARKYFQEFTGAPLTPGAIAIFTAQSALETGRWKAIHCYNVGNIKANITTYTNTICQFRCSEMIAHHEVWFDPPHPQCNFRAYYDLDAGVLDYLQLLATKTRYALAWAAALRGDPHVFVQALAKAGYFTANAAAYERGVMSLHAKYLAEYLRTPHMVPPDHAEEAEWARLRGLVIAAQFDIA